MNTNFNYLRVTLSTGTKRLVSIQRIIDFVKKQTPLSTEEIIFQINQNPQSILDYAQQMKWNDAFPCRCMGGLILDWDNEWISSKKELI